MAARTNTDERRAQIVEGLLTVMAASGYEGATIVAIGKAAGLSSGLVHYHFATKDEVLLALVDRLVVGVRVRYEAAAAHGVQRIELILNGDVVASVAGATDEQSGELRTAITRSGWMALRAWELTPDNRLRLAHTAPVWFDVPDFPAVPKSRETSWLVSQVEEQLARHRGVLPDDALIDYETALTAYRAIHAHAR